MHEMGYFVTWISNTWLLLEWIMNDTFEYHIYSLIINCFINNSEPP